MTKQKHTKAVSAASKAEELLPLEQMMSQGSAPNEGASHTVDDTHQVTDSEHQGTESEGASLVPKLRFVGFTGSWFICKMDGCICLISGRDLLLSEIESTPSSDQSVPYITGASQIIGGKIAVNRWTARPSVISRHGDLLLTCKGTIGLMVFNAIGDVHIARQIMALRPIGDKLHSVFLKYLETHSIEQILADSRGLIPGIERSSVLSMPCVIPKLAEQQRIGALFKELDHNIELNCGLLEKLTQLKKSMLEQMFPREGESVPRLRFAGFTEPWTICKLGDLGQAISGIGFPESAQGGMEGIPFFKVSDMNLEGNESVMHYANNYVSYELVAKSKWKPIEGPAVIFVRDGAAVLLNRKRLILSKCLMDHHIMHYCLDESVWNPFFALAIFEGIDLTALVRTSVTPSYGAAEVEAIVVKVPNLAEQQRIGAFFKALDQRIAQQRAKLEKLGQLKKALLEQMFV